MIYTVRSALPAVLCFFGGLSALVFSGQPDEGLHRAGLEHGAEGLDRGAAPGGGVPAEQFRRNAVYERPDLGFGGVPVCAGLDGFCRIDGLAKRVKSRTGGSWSREGCGNDTSGCR